MNLIFFAKSKKKFKSLDNFLLLLTHISSIDYLFIYSFIIFQIENSVWRIKSLVPESIGYLCRPKFNYARLMEVWCLNTALAAVNYISCKQLLKNIPLCAEYTSTSQSVRIVLL